MASISLRNVTKIFEPSVTAVGDLSLEVPDGRLVVLVGPSGCGKTTTLSLIAGLDRPTSGEIRIGGQVVNAWPPRQRNVAMVFQDGALYPHMTVRANLAFALRIRGAAEAETLRRVDAAARMLGIAELMNRRPAELSGGQRQRVALGRAIVREPAAFLFDEPLAGLDARLRAALRREIKSLHQKLHVTMLYVTHDQAEAMTLAQEMCVLRHGRVQQVGPPQEIYNRPANRFVAGFFGTPAMSFLTGRVRAEDGGVLVDFGSDAVHLPSAVRTRLAGYGRETVVVGIRPHNLSLEPLSGQSDNVLCGRVGLIEPLGSQTDVHIDLPGGQPCIVAARPGIPLNIGDQMRVYMNLDELHLFEDDEAGRNLPSPAPD
jgi:multiple sugar transport system ATP-binding protein